MRRVPAHRLPPARITKAMHAKKSISLLIKFAAVQREERTREHFTPRDGSRAGQGEANKDLVKEARPVML